MLTLMLALHIFAAAVFVGGLVTLGVVASVARKQVSESESIELFKASGRRFLSLAALAFATLIATGFYMADRRLSSFAELFDSEWGRVLADKLGLVLLVMALVAVHSFTVGPSMGRLRRKALQSPTDQALQRRVASRQRLTNALNGAILLLAIAIIYLAARLATL